MLTSRYNPETEQLWREFQQLSKRVEELETPDAQSRAARAWGQAVGGLLWLPRQNGTWLGTGVTNELDFSGNGRTLTNNAGATHNTEGLVPYTALASASSQYYSRTLETWMQGTGSLWVTCWAYFATLGADTGIMSRWVAGGNNLHWLLRKTAGDIIYFGLSGDGSTSVNVQSTVSVAINTWCHLFAWYNPPTSLNIMVNGTLTTNTTSIPAAGYGASTADLNVGRYNAANYMNGRLALMATGGISDNIEAIGRNYYRQTRRAFGV